MSIHQSSIFGIFIKVRVGYTLKNISVLKSKDEFFPDGVSTLCRLGSLRNKSLKQLERYTYPLEKNDHFHK